MRALPAVLLLTLLLAGCAGFPGESTSSSSSSLFSYCPQWTTGPGMAAQHIALLGHENLTVRLDAPSGLAYEGHPLDLVTMKVTNLTTGGGAIVVRVFADAGGAAGTQLAIRSLRGDAPAYVPLLPFSTAADAQREFEVLLSPVTHGSPPAAGPLWLQLSNEGGQPGLLDLGARFGYRVCGA